LFELTFGGRLFELSFFEFELIKAPHELITKSSNNNKTEYFFIFRKISNFTTATIFLDAFTPPATIFIGPVYTEFFKLEILFKSAKFDNSLTGVNLFIITN